MNGFWSDAEAALAVFGAMSLTGVIMLCSFLWWEGKRYRAEKGKTK